MNPSKRLAVVSRVVVLLVATGLVGCAAPRAWDEANRLLAEGRPEQALPQLEEAVKQQPRNATFRAALLRERARVASEQLVRGDQLLRAGALDEAQAAYEAAQRTDPENGRAAYRLKELAQARQQAAQVRGAQALFDRGDISGAEAVLRTVLAENPQQRDARGLLRRVVEQSVAATPEPKLVAPFRKPITLEFRDAPIRTVFDMLSKTSGINFVFDRDVKPDARITVFLRNTSLEDALKLILTTNTLDRKLLNENSVLIYPNTPAKQKDYKELLVRSWYLANADVKQASAMVKALMKAQDVFIDEKLNLMVVKDTPEVVRLADQLVRTLDVAEPEVMLEVEVLEVARSRLDEIGVRWPTSANLSAAGANNAINTAATVPVDSPAIFTTTNPLLVFNLRATVGQTNLLANPRIRVRNKEKARVHIGDKVPVFTTTATANVGVATSVSYLDVGLKLDVEPQIYLQDEVGIKIGLEVSNIIETITTNNSVAYRLGTRNANTVLQLRDGETQILAGLINDEDRRTSNRIPGLGDLPMLDRLFGSRLDQKVKTEIVLLITPRIVRNVMRPEGLLAELPVGTDTFPGLPPLRIARTKAGDLAMAAGGAGGPTAVFDDMPPASNPFTIAWTAPTQAQVGREFVVSLQFPPGRWKSGALAITYDPALLAPAGAPPAVPGQLRVAFDNGALPRTLRMRAIGDKPGTAKLQLADADLVDDSNESIAVTLPEPLAIEVAKP